MKPVADMTTGEMIEEIRKRLEKTERKIEREAVLVKDILYTHDIRYLLDLIDRGELRDRLVKGKWLGGPR